MDDLCEWDPEHDTAATTDGYGCQNPATVLVGGRNVNWRLCASCAELPQFRRLRRRVPIRVTCPDGPHRGPEGPNEDIGQCPTCWSLSWSLRPGGETYGEHIPDCSLPRRHEGRCAPGGAGHSPAEVIRGYWPATE